MKRSAIATILVLVGVAGSLSVFVGVPYVVSAIGFSALVFMGHLVTLDDDAPGGWSNPEESQEVWAASKRALALKGCLPVLLGALAMVWPALARCGA